MDIAEQHQTEQSTRRRINNFGDVSNFQENDSQLTTIGKHLQNIVSNPSQRYVFLNLKLNMKTT